MKKKIACDIFSRVTGYYQPVRLWNPGKKSEFSERHTEMTIERKIIQKRRLKKAEVRT